MVRILVSDKEREGSSLLYIQNSLVEVLGSSGCKVKTHVIEGRAELIVECPEYYSEIIHTEVCDRVSEVIAVRYKYNYFSSAIKMGGLNQTEKEILFASLIAADLPEDKKYAFERIKRDNLIAIDGAFNFRMQPLKKKWEDIVSYVPSCLINSQLTDFVTYLLENKKKRIYIDNGKVYDSHYRRLKRRSLLGGVGVDVVREVLLSNCGEIELNGKIPEEDEFYLKQFYGDKIIFSGGCFC